MSRLCLCLWLRDGPTSEPAVLAGDVRIERFEAAVSHLESLHAHAAVARVNPAAR